MVKLSYPGRNTAIVNATKLANHILSNPAFYQKVAALPQLDNTKLTSPEIAHIMQQASHSITIGTYWWPFGANAGTKTSDFINVNSAKFSSILSVGVNTLVHETVHAVDFLDGKTDFTHFDNDPDGEDNTAPWRIGAIAQAMAKNPTELL